MKIKVNDRDVYFDFKHNSVLIDSKTGENVYSGSFDIVSDRPLNDYELEKIAEFIENTIKAKGIKDVEKHKLFESANEVKYCDECNSPITDDNLCINGCHFIDKLREDYYA